MIGTEVSLKFDHSKSDAISATHSRKDRLRNCEMRVAMLSQGRGRRLLSSVQHPVDESEATELKLKSEGSNPQHSS